MAPAPVSRLRAGWYPDPDGEDQYRLYDGYEWSERVTPIPPSRRAKFEVQRDALERYLAAIATPDVSTVVRARAGISAHERNAMDPGRSLGTAAFVVAVFGLWPVAAIMSQMSRNRSNLAGFPRNRFSAAALAASALWVLMLISFGIVVLVRG